MLSRQEQRLFAAAEVAAALQAEAIPPAEVVAAGVVAAATDASMKRHEAAHCSFSQERTRNVNEKED